MKKIALLLPLTLLLTALPCAAQGPLSPPGTPAPTMKTLEQIEPRTPISSAGYVITQSGSYYLISNLTAVAAQDGITVHADDVTIDLNGFTLIGSGTNSGHGIYQTNSLRNLRVYNGKVVRWGGASKGGVYVLGKNNQLDHIQAATSYIGIEAGPNSRISDCSAYSNSVHGICTSVACTISDCSAYQNSQVGIYIGIGSTISDCSAYGNSTYGIWANHDSTISGCVARYNSNHGIFVSGSDSKISGNTCDGNGWGGVGAGIYVNDSDNRIGSNNATDNDFGIYVNSIGNLIIRNSARGNSTNYVIASNNVVGAILSPTPSGAISGSAGGGGWGSTDPWANFAF